MVDPGRLVHLGLWEELKFGFYMHTADGSSLRHFQSVLLFFDPESGEREEKSFIKYRRTYTLFPQCQQLS